MFTTNYENKLPDCLFIKLHGKTISKRQFEQNVFNSIVTSIFNKGRTSEKEIELQLTIRFGEYQYPANRGTITFGLRGGNLKLNVVNGKILLETFGLTRSLKTQFQIEIQKENSQENDRGMSIKNPINMNAKSRTKETQKFVHEVSQVYTRGTEEQPTWVFQTQNSDKIIVGFLSQVKIGDLQVENKPCVVEAIFEITDENIEVTKTTGVWMNAQRNILAVTQRAFLLKMIRPQIDPYISRAELLYE